MPIKTVLLVEDNAGDARLIREMFNGEGSQEIKLALVPCMQDAEKYLAANSVDIVVLDLELPDAQGLVAVRRVHAAAPHVPLLVLTGLDDESIATQALQEGAQDYLVKWQTNSHGSARRLRRSLRQAIERKAMAQQISQLADYDVLTGLPNRLLLNDRIDQAIALAKRHGKCVAILVLDLDGFKHINDSLGHPIGDRLLKSVAARLALCVRASDTVSRQGGDEFVVLLSEVEDADHVADSAMRMLKAVAKFHSIDLNELYITTSIGVSMYPRDGHNAETLIKNADAAMYQAKENGRQSYQFFKPAMNVRAVERQSIEEHLRRALERNEFSLCYQPKINLKTGAISGAEALLRWTNATRGLVPPAQFIPIAEDCGLILPIGAWVLREACKQAQAWTAAGLPATTMAVNVSALEFGAETFLPGVFAILSETGMNPKLLELELTESVLMKRAWATAAILQSLRERGIKVAVDDFGTGYSSLSYLRNFPVDALKIDQSFVRKIGTIDDDTKIVTAVIAMARSLNLRVVAEGVETLEQLNFLRAHQCDEAQGYYFSRPLLPPQFTALLQSVGIPLRVRI